MDGGKIDGLTVQKIKSVFDAQMRFNPTYEPGVFKTIPGDTVILAIGQLPDNSFLAGSGLNLNRLEWVLRAFENGTAGVAVVACREGRCLYKGGPSTLTGVIARAGDLLKSAVLREKTP